jgi:Tol biopolymer transport system component
MSTTPTHPTALRGATTKETTMSSKTLLFTLGALALAACESPTEPMPANLEARVDGPWQPEPPMPLRQQRIAFASTRDGNYEIYVMNLDGSGVVRLTTNTAGDRWPALSPDGRRIAFESDRDGQSEIYVMSVDGSGVSRLTYNASWDTQPTWSPDGAKIAFMCAWEICIMNVDGSGILNLTASAGPDYDPAWSPDGSKIAFTSYRDGGPNVYVMNATDGSGVRLLTGTTIGLDEHPAWSPDGTKIAFRSTRDGGTDIYVMNARDGSEVRRLTSTTAALGPDGHPDWSPDGSKIAFTLYPNGYGNSGDIYVMSATDGKLVTDRKLVLVRLTHSGAEHHSWGWAP